MGLQYNSQTGELEEVADDEIDRSNYDFGYGTQTLTLSDAEVEAELERFREEYKDEIPNMEGFEKKIGAANIKSVTDFLSKYGKKALDLFKDKEGKLDWTKLLSMAGGAYAASRPSGSTPTGYQGKIPKLTATSNMLTAPPVGRRPGSGGINYGGGVTYRDPAGNVISSNEKTLEELRQAAINNPFNRGATYEGQQGGLGQSDLVALLNQLNPSGGTGTSGGTGGSGGGAGGTGVTVGGGIPGRGADTRPTVSAGTVKQGYSRNYKPQEIQAIRAGFLENRDNPQKMMDLMTQYGVSVNDIATAMGGDVQGYQNIFLQAGADPSFGGMASYQPTANDTAYIDYMLTQPNPLGQGTLADVYKNQGINPYTDPRVIAQARQQNQRYENRNDLYGGTLSVDQGAPWQNPNWLANQNAAAAATAQRQQAQAAQDAASGVSVGGGIAGSAPPPNVNDWAQTQEGQAAGGINSVYNSINQFLATNPDQAALQSAMQQYGVDQATLDAAKAYGGGFAAGGLAPEGFVIPADVVSHLGNGSSEAGLKLLVANLGAEPIKGEGDGMSDSIPTTIGGKQEARVANDEAFISPEMVKRIGGGDAKKGAKKLYAMMDRVREERTGTKEQGKQIDPNKFMPGGSVQKYQTGGTTVPKTTFAGATGVESSLSNWGGDYVTNMLGQGAALANKPYEAYTGPLTAGASGLQNQAFTQAAGLKTPASIGQAATTAGGIASLAPGAGKYTPVGIDFGAAQAQQYMNPYVQSALEPALEEARRQADISRVADAGRLTQAGAYGGSRQAIMESEGRRNLMDKQNQMLTSGYSTAFDKAQQQFNADQARKIQEQQFGTTSGLQGLQTGIQGAQAQGQLGALESQTGLAGLNALTSLGSVQRGIESEGIAADKAQFEEARLNPYKMVQFQQSLLSGLPLAAQSYNIPGQSNLQQFAGGATTIQQLLDILSGKTTATTK
jgi:hypothetical protein